jgi:hypothetical protein
VICWLWDEPMTGRFGYGMNQWHPIYLFM